MANLCKIKILFVLVFINPGIHLNAQTPPCSWAHNPSGVNFDSGNSVCTDLNGNVIVVGFFSNPTITFGPFTLTNSGILDVFLVKYSPLGTVLWAFSAGGSSFDYANNVCCDDSGNVIVTGTFRSSSISFGNITLTNLNNSNDVFVVKYSPLGAAMWAKSAGGAKVDEGTGVSTDHNGNVYLTGTFESQNVVFGASTLNNTGSNSNDIFLVKYNAAGTELWAISVGGSDYDYSSSLATDPSGNVFLSGYFLSPSITFGAITLNKFQGSGFTSNMFLVKYSPSGTVYWARTAGGVSINAAASLATDKDWNVYVVGCFSSPSIHFGGITLTNSDNSGNTKDVFVVKYTTTGTELWAKSAEGDLDDRAAAVSVDVAGNAYLTGTFQSPYIGFGMTALSNADQTGGTSDIFTVKYNPSGTLQWVKSAGGSSYDSGYGISKASDGSILMTGSFLSSSLSFDACTLTNTGNGDCFVVKLQDFPVGINESENTKLVLNIYPNPFNFQTTLTFSGEQKNANIRMLDLLGNEVMTISNITGRELVIEKGNLKSGVYIVEIWNQNKVMQCTKLVVE